MSPSALYNTAIAILLRAIYALIATFSAAIYFVHELISVSSGVRSINDSFSPDFTEEAQNSYEIMVLPRAGKA